MFDPGTAEHMLTVVKGDIDYIRETSGQYLNGNVQPTTTASTTTWHG